MPSSMPDQPMPPAFAHRYFRTMSLVLGLLLFVPPAWAQAERGIMIREADLYIAPDAKSAKLGTVQRGREVALMERSRDYLKVLADMGAGPEGGSRRVTGWLLDKGVIFPSTPNGDRILFGEAVDSENEAARRGGRKGADRDALRLYYRMAEYFPKSDRAGEALWRAADIGWQLGREDIVGRRSYREMDPGVRPKLPEEAMNEVRKKFPGTKWAALADYAKLENKLCGEWRGLPKCPEKETELYLDYVKDHPGSPKAAEALYEAAWRQAALVDIYSGDNDAAKAEQARKRVRELTDRIVAIPEAGDIATRAAALAFKVAQGISTYGAGRQ